MENLSLKKFSDIDLGDPFFDSLKADYREFEEWFLKKSQTTEKAYVMEDDGIQAFLYLKLEVDEITDVNPTMAACRRLKVGTFKVNPHGTRLGERFIKKIFDHAIRANVSEAYVTIFPKHEGLISILKQSGFRQYGLKQTTNGEESVFTKQFFGNQIDLLANYPRFTRAGRNKHLLAIYPEYHTRLFPDSILNNESFDVVQDVSYTNSIYKIYVTTMEVNSLRHGDLIVIYRTGDGQAPAHYRAVVTSVCVVAEVKSKNDFASLEEYLAYCRPYSVFNDQELTEWYKNKKLYVIKMLYNAAFQRRLTRGNLIENIGLNPSQRWSFIRLSDDHFNQILLDGGINENLIID